MKSRFLKAISALCLAAMLLGACAISTSAAQNSDWSNTKKATLPEYAYSFAVVGDTQVVARDEAVTSAETYDSKYTGNFSKIYDWIVSNKSLKNIQFSFHMGDVTDWNNAAEWDLAMENLTKLEGKIPYNIARGNHDQGPTMSGRYTVEMFKNSVTNGEEYGFFDGRGIENYSVNTLNAYQTITVGDVMYLMLSLDLGPCKAVVEWANEVIEAHPYHNVIISTHSYLQGDYDKAVTGGGIYMDAPKDCSATQYNPGGYYNGGGYKENGSFVNWDFRLQQHKSGGENYLYQDASVMLNTLVKKHDNISMVLCGHECSEYVKQISTTSNGGKTILQFLVDGQGVDRELQKQGRGHAGLVAMFYFSADGKKVTTEYYSTIREQYLRDTENTKTYDVNVVSVPQSVKDAYKVIHSVCEADYSSADWAEISPALESAKQTVTTTTSSSAISNAISSLKASLEGKAKLDRSALSAALVAADGKIEIENTIESWKKFTTALKTAELAKKAQDQAQINRAAKLLTDAIANLKAPDYTALGEALETAKQFEGKESEYDAAAWKTFTTALKEAKKYTDSRSQSTINAVARNLNNAMAAFMPELDEGTQDDLPVGDQEQQPDGDVQAPTPDNESDVNTDGAQTDESSDATDTTKKPSKNDNTDKTDSDDSEDKPQKTKDKGCGSTITASAVVLATVLTLGLGFKKKKD